MTDLRALGRHAVALHHQGRLAEAEALYRRRTRLCRALYAQILDDQLNG